jgi:hypothetical protein
MVDIYLDNLVLAIVYQAILDAHNPSVHYYKKAVEWLLSSDCEWITDYFGITEDVKNWVMQGCQLPPDKTRLDSIIEIEGLGD